MATATGTWSSNITAGFIDLARHRSKQLTKDHLIDQRTHHYTFDVYDNGLDINGFILQTDKHKGKRQKFRVYLDSNENNRFDKNDVLLGRIGLKTRHSKNGVGGILDEDELGQIEVKFKKPKSNASMRADEENYSTIRDTPLHGTTIPIKKSETFISAVDPDGSEVATFEGEPGGLPF